MRDGVPCVGPQPFTGLEASDGKRENKVLLKEMGILALLLLQGLGMVLGKLLFMHKEGLDFPGPQGEG